MRKFRLGLGRHTEEAITVSNGPDTTASLLANGLDVRVTELASVTPLQRAAAEGHVDIVHQLLKHGADVNHQDAVHGNSALHEAAWRGYSQTAVLLCRQKCNLNLANRAGFTPLHLSCQNGHNETTRVLLIAGASPNAKNHYGDSPLHTSARYGHAGVMRILISADCNVSEQNKNGDSALHIAAAMGRRKLTRILLSAGCSMSLRNKQGETAVDIAKRKEFHEIVSLLENPPSFGTHRSRDRGHRDKSNDRERSKSKSKSKREKTDSATSSKDSSSRGKHKDKKRRKEQHDGKDPVNGRCRHFLSPYGCHTSPELASALNPKLNSLPNEPLQEGEQYYLDLGGNIRKGPIGVPTCYCGPLLHRLECRLDKDKRDILHRLDTAHSRLDAKIDGLERKTKQQLQGLQRTVDSLGLESSAAGLQRVRNSIVLAEAGHVTPMLPTIDLANSTTSQSHSRFGSSDVSISKLSDAKPFKVLDSVCENSVQNEVQYTLDKLGLDVSSNADHNGSSNAGLQELRNRLALTRLQEQKELDAIVEHYERRNQIAEDKADETQSEDEENDGDVIPLPILNSHKSPMLSDSRYENYDYPSSIAKPFPTYSSLPSNGIEHSISYRNLPLPRYHLDPVLENGLPSKPSQTPPGVIDSSMYVRHYPGHELLGYHDERDRHNDSGYSTRPGESSHGPSPSLSGQAESYEGDPLRSPRLGRRADHFQSHFARDLARTLPNNTNTPLSTVQNGYPRVRFTVPLKIEDQDILFPPGTISSSSLV